MNDAFTRRGFSQTLGLGLLTIALPKVASADALQLTARFEQRPRNSGYVDLVLHLRHNQANALVFPTRAIHFDAFPLTTRQGPRSRTGRRRPITLEGDLAATFAPSRRELRSRRLPPRQMTIAAGAEQVYGTLEAELSGSGTMRVRLRGVLAPRRGEPTPEELERLNALARITSDIDLSFA